MDLVVNRTRDGRRHPFAGVPAHAPDNPLDDHGRPARADYAVSMLRLPALTVLDGETGEVITSLLPFGTAEPNELLARTVRLMNSGGGVLTLGTLVIAGAAFTIASGPEQTSLASREHTPVVLHMQSSEEGTFAGTLTIPSNAVDSPRELALTGSVAASSCHPLGVAWGETVAARGGVATAGDQAIICDLAAALADKDYVTEGRLWLLCPFVGQDLTAKCVPLINLLRETANAEDGSLVVHARGLSDSDITANGALTGASATKYLYLGDASQGEILQGKDATEAGIGYWNLQPALTDDDLLGASGCGDGRLGGLSPAWIATMRGNRFGLRRGFQLNNPLWDSVAMRASGDGAGLYDIAHRHNAWAKLYLDGSLVDTDTSVDGAAVVNCRHLVMAWGHFEFGGTPSTIEPDFVFAYGDSILGCYYMRGAMSDAEVQDLYEVLRDHLMIPTGRVAP